MNPILKAHIALLIVALFYGANYSIAKIVMADDLIHPFTFILIRVFSGMGFFVVFHKLFIKEKIDKTDIPLFFLCGLFGVAVNQLFFFSGLRDTTPIHASLLMITTPLIVLIISSVILKVKLTKLNIFGILLGAFGAFYLIVEGKDIGFESQYVKGDVKIFINAVSYAFYLVLVKRLLNKYNPFTITKWIFLFGSILVLPFGLPEFLKWDTSVLNYTHYLAILYVVIGTTILAYLFSAFALSKLRPTTVGVYIYLQPLIAGFISIQWGQDELTLPKVIAGLIIFVGVLVAGWRPAVSLVRK